MAVPISNVTRRQVYSPSGTGGAGPYSFTFEILANTDIAVYKDDTLLTLTTHYTVTINSNGTGSVTITAAGLALSPTSPTQYAIVGNRTIQRTSDFTTGGDFFANTINDELDQQTIFAQQNAEGLARALTAPQTDPTSINMTLPSKANRALKTLSFDVNGNPTPGVSAADVANATTYATNAANSATAAASSASSASSSASSASSSASTASTQASNASTSATNAASSASGASTSATAAAGSASTASTQASNASTSATNAASSASAASTSAANAATSATSAETAKTAAESARDATLAAYDSFDDRYLGAKSSDPSVDNDGNALTAGSLYFNSVDNVMKLWTGSAWVAAYVSGAGFMDLSSSQTAAGTKTFSSNPILSGGTANGVAYLNGSKVLTTGSALVFDGTNLGVGVTPSSQYSTVKAFQVGVLGATIVTGQTVAGGTSSFGQNWYVDPTTANYFYAAASSQPATRYSQTAGQHQWFYASAGTAGNNITFNQAMTLNASGNLGIGTTSPTARLSINTASANSTAATIGGLDYSGTKRGLTIKTYQSAGGDDCGVEFNAADGLAGYGAFKFAANTTTLATIDASGNLLVGTTSVNSVGVISVDFLGQTKQGITLDDTWASTGGVYILFRNSAGDTAGRIDHNGTTTVAYTTSSDYRLKENIAPMTGALAKVLQLNPVTYKWKSDGTDGQGFIAHELQAIVPDAVVGAKDAMNEDGSINPQGIDTSFLVATLTAAIQEQQSLITTLTARISALESA